MFHRFNRAIHTGIRRGLTTGHYVIIAAVGALVAYGGVAYTGQEVDCLLQNTGFHVSVWANSTTHTQCGNVKQHDLIYWTAQGSSKAPLRTMRTITPGKSYQEAILPAISTTGSNINYTLEKTVNGDMPSQLSFDTASGVLVTSNGTVPISAAGKSFTMVVTAADSVGNTTDTNYINVKIQNDTITWEQQGDPYTAVNSTPGVPYTQTLKADSSLYNDISYNLISGTLPAGLQFSPQNTPGSLGMVISGTPNVCPTALSQSLTFQASDGLATPVSLNVLVPVIQDKLVWSDGLYSGNQQRLPSYIPGQPYSANVVYTTSTINLPITQNFDGALPTGLTYNPTTHIISGTVPLNQRPAGDVTVDFTAKDASCDANNVTLSSTRPIVIPQLPDAITWNKSSPYTMPQGTVGQAYSAAVPTGSSAWYLPVTYTLDSGTLPRGLNYNPSTNTISGTPNDPTGGTYTLVFRGSDGIVSSTITTSIYIVPDILTWDDNSTDVMVLAGYTPNSSYNQNLVNANSSLNYGVTYSIGSGMADSLNYNSDGNSVSGTPSYTTDGDGNIYTTVTATDGYATITRSVKIPRIPDSITWSHTNLPDAQQGATYNQTLNRASSLYKMPITYAIQGVLPQGMTINNQGVIGGRPTANFNETITFTVIASDGVASASQVESIYVKPDIITWADNSYGNQVFPAYTPSQNYDHWITTASSSLQYPITYSLGPGLTYGMTWSPNHVTASPAQYTSYSNTTVYAVLTATDGWVSSQRVIEIPRAADVVTMPYTGLASGGTGRYYNQTLNRATSLYGLGITYSITSGSLPQGLSMNSNGVITGTATQTWNGTSWFNVTASDGVTSATVGESIYVEGDWINWSDGGTGTIYLGGYTPNQWYDVWLPSASSHQNYNISYWNNGGMNFGLNYSPNHVNGTPYYASGDGTIYTSVTAGDGWVNSTRSVQIPRNGDYISWSYTGMNNGSINQWYSQTLNRASSYYQLGVSYYISSGGLPQGLSMNSNGVISGTPTQTWDGTSWFNVTATDGVTSSTIGESIYIQGDTLTWNDGGCDGCSEPLVGGTQNQPYTPYLVAAFSSTTGNNIQYTYSGGPPPGLSFYVTSISGYPQQAGSWWYRITASDGIKSISRTFTINIAAADYIYWETSTYENYNQPLLPGGGTTSGNGTPTGLVGLITPLMGAWDLNQNSAPGRIWAISSTGRQITYYIGSLPDNAVNDWKNAHMSGSYSYFTGSLTTGTSAVRFSGSGSTIYNMLSLVGQYGTFCTHMSQTLTPIMATDGIATTAVPEYVAVAITEYGCSGSGGGHQNEL